jgi:translocator protein
MADDQSNKQANPAKIKKDSQTIDKRPLDPTRNAEDVLGDPTGRAGVTTGDPRQISAEPDEVAKDDSVIRGGNIGDPANTKPSGFTDEQLDEAAYDKNTLDGMSGTRAAANKDLASEEEVNSSNENTEGGINSDFNYDANFSKNMHDSDHGSGEDDAAGGTTPDVESDDDVGDMMARVTGQDPDPNMDNPQELGLGDEVDKDEDEHLHSWQSYNTSVKQISWIKLLIALAISYTAAAIGSVFTIDAIPTWYAALKKPFFIPPNWVFGPVWLLYTLMGLSLYLVWNNKNMQSVEKKPAYSAFTFQLLLNIVWSFVFFGFKRPLVALIVILFLLVGILWTFVRFRKLDVLASWLLIPYLIWVSFASLLNLSIVILN